MSREYTDTERLDYLASNPRDSQFISSDGVSQPCQFFGIAGPHGVQLRELIDNLLRQQEAIKGN